MDSSAYSATERRGVMAIFSRLELRAIIHREKWPVAALAKRLCYAQYLCRRCGPEKGPAGPERGAGHHRSIESGRLAGLALPDVLPARTRHRLGGMFLCHRLLADGTILTPHTGPAFCSTNRLRAGGNVKLIDHGVEFFQLLHCCEKLERFSISGYRPG